MTINRTLISAILLSAIAVGRDPRWRKLPPRGPVVSCDDGRRGAVGRRHHLARRHAIECIAKPECHHRQQIVGEGGPGVFVGQGKGAVPLDDPNAPNKARCAILDGVSYCY